ncbi:hypothetical protein GCM10011371_30860 [Novosphingobium marinum]|uniref:DUF2491 family protein n=1 Tax=Novosphingobium marinum TaxID=1514948 RepID=A0A7Y9XUQ5_9SPHN|nr:DUF2491 family protein [Novosphingobium marinum]NYH94961.1 hypothetical protein [Novosphingobium marinum]GGC41258.1 hypothetical protein GCM10011371_30860 [Novosphingobium marinum]
MIRSLFGGRKKDSLPEERGPFRCAINGAFHLDTLGLQASLASGEPAMGAPESGNFVVTAIGTAQLDAGAELTRYYDDEHRMLQVIAPPGAGPESIADVSFYAPWDSVVPAGQGEWDRWTGARGLIGAPEYDADGILFTRYWGEGEDHADLVEFVEKVDDGETAREIHQRCMLYARPVGKGEEMLLLNIERDLAVTARQQGSSIEFLIGYGLGAADVHRV